MLTRELREILDNLSIDHQEQEILMQTNDGIYGIKSVRVISEYDSNNGFIPNGIILTRGSYSKLNNDYKDLMGDDEESEDEEELTEDNSSNDTPSDTSNEETS